MKAVLVTGGSGFIGSNFLNYMVQRYPTVQWINVDAMYYCADSRNIDKAIRDSENYHEVHCKIQDVSLINKILESFDVDTVVHFAAQSHVQDSFSDPLKYTEDNVVGTHRLIHTCHHYGKIERFIHVSTDEVYGQSLLSDENSKREDYVLEPTNPYAATKAAAEHIVKSYYLSYKFPVIITRCNNVYGPNQYPEKVIPRFILQLINGKPCTIQGSGEQVRSFIYVSDVVRAYELLLLDGTIGEVYNIGCDDELSVNTVHQILNTVMYDEEIIRDKLPAITIADRNFNDQRYFISTEKINALGWKPTVDFTDGIRKTIDYYSFNRKRWADLFN